MLVLSAVACLLLPLSALADSEVYTIPKPSAHWYETFVEGWEQRWQASKAEKYSGPWKVQAVQDEEVKALEGEAGLYVTLPAKHYAISSAFSSPIGGTEGQDFVIQYELRLHKPLDCGGAYVKVLAADKDFDPEAFDNETPYIVMFGPDKCGGNDRIHVIIRYQHPIKKTWEEKHWKQNQAQMPVDGKTHLYTLTIRQDNTFSVAVDQKVKHTGSLYEDFQPAFLPPKEIDDPTDLKPADWVDEAEIPDPDQSKPEDWDEEAPPTIEDPAASKPAKWCDDCLLEIADPNAVKPDDWDEEEDGEFEPPIIRNPICVEVGCGTWNPPQIKNPAYKGKWHHPMIPNPDYKGVWKARQIPNPDYFTDDNVHRLFPMGALGIELWTMSGGLEFDNLLVDTSIETAKQFAAATWAKKSAAESTSTSDFIQGLVDLANEQPSLVAGAGVVLVMAVVGLLYLCCSCGGAEETTTLPSSSAASVPAKKQEQREAQEEEVQNTEEENEEESEQEEENDEGEKQLRKRGTKNNQ